MLSRIYFFTVHPNQDMGGVGGPVGGVVGQAPNYMQGGGIMMQQQQNPQMRMMRPGMQPQMGGLRQVRIY